MRFAVVTDAPDAGGERAGPAIICQSSFYSRTAKRPTG
jgi:hypothetical protein